MLEAHRVTMRFGGLTALSDVDFAVTAASISGLVGPNGAGKTTLFGILSGLLRPTAGEVFMSGHRVTGASPQERARRGLGRTFQRIELFWELTVREHFVLAHRARHQRHRLWSDLLGVSLRRRDAAEDAAVAQLLHDLRLENEADRVVASLPLGTGRLVEVGRALAGDPTVLLLDEPSSGLDRHETDQLAETLRRARDDRGVALVLVEHDLDLVLGISEKVTVLDFGCVIASGTPDEIRSDARVQAAYIGGGAR